MKMALELNQFLNIDCMEGMTQQGNKALNERRIHPTQLLTRDT